MSRMREAGDSKVNRGKDRNDRGTHDQGYPLLGAKGNDMEDRNLGFNIPILIHRISKVITSSGSSPRTVPKA